MLLPLLVVVQVAMPGTLGTMKSMLNPSYLIKEQSYDQGASAGRAADLGPALDRWATKPFLGSGFGTTVADPNAPKESEKQILDDQWLGSLLEIGAFGVLALLWLYVRAIRRLTAVAKGLTGSDAWLAVALAAAIISFAVGHAHLRRVRVHPGHVPGLRAARALVGRREPAGRPRALSG